MKNKFKALIDDSGAEVHSQVWNITNDISIEYLYAEFYGKHCKKYARAHAKMLNGLPEEDQP